MTEGAGQGDGARAPAGRPSVRPITRRDVDEIIALLREPWSDISVDGWRAVFEHGWGRGEADLGFVLVDGRRIVGYLGTILARRRFGADERWVCNITSWYVREGYRTGSIGLLKAVLAKADVITVVTPSKPTRPIFESLGFRLLETHRFVYFPLLHLWTLLRAPRARLLSRPEEIEPELDAEQRRLLHDLRDTACGHFLLREGARRCYFVVKKRHDLRLCAQTLWTSDVLYCSDPELLHRHLERVVLAVLARQRTCALMADSRILGRKGPLGLRVEDKKYIRGSGIDPRTVDNLYTEIALLPI